MENLFWKNNEGTESLVSTPFNSEEEFEKLVFNTPELLEDIFLLRRQIRGGNKNGIPDIVGIDNDGNICIVEMKNVTVDASIIPQVLQYAFWAETNPDSIKSLWLETDDKPDDLSISWDDFKVRIIVIAPKILPSSLDIVEKINYQVDLIEISRWFKDSNQLLFVKKLEQEEKFKRGKTVSGLEDYNEEFYKKNYNKESAKYFIKFTNDVEKLINTNSWGLEKKYNKHYCSFKAGFFNAFGIKWLGTKTFAFFFKISEEEAREINPSMTKYESQWKEAIYTIDPKLTSVRDFLPLFEKAYNKITGK